MTCECNQCKALQHNIEKIEKELDDIEKGTAKVCGLGENFEGIIDERIEHLVHLRDTLVFIRDKPFVEINL